MTVRPYCYSPSAELPFFVFDPEGDGLLFFRTAAERDAKAKEVIEEHLYDGEWSPEVTRICCGQVTHVAAEANREDRPEDPEQAEEEGWPEDCEWRCNYVLQPL